MSVFSLELRDKFVLNASPKKYGQLFSKGAEYSGNIYCRMRAILAIYLSGSD